MQLDCSQPDQNRSKGWVLTEDGFDRCNNTEKLCMATQSSGGVQLVSGSGRLVQSKADGNCSQARIDGVHNRTVAWKDAVERFDTCNTRLLALTCARSVSITHSAHSIFLVQRGVPVSRNGLVSCNLVILERRAVLGRGIATLGLVLSLVRHDGR